jgi:hypothetical protein
VQCTDRFAIRLKQSKFITLRDLTIVGTGAQAISLMGGNNGNQGIHIIGNRIFGNGSASCDGGITIARNNPDTLIVNNLIYGNGRNGINFIDADGGPHYVFNNTIYGNGWNGINVARNHQIVLANNIIFQNGTASGTTGGRFGVQRESSSSPRPAGITLYSNLVCGNIGGEVNAPVLDDTEAGNLTRLRGFEGLKTGKWLKNRSLGLKGLHYRAVAEVAWGAPILGAGCGGNSSLSLSRSNWSSGSGWL